MKEEILLEMFGPFPPEFFSSIVKASVRVVVKLGRFTRDIIRL